MPVNPEPDYYEILGVEQDSSQEEIDKAFRKARRDHHPDRSSTGAWAFRLVETAYETLKDPDRRKSYDEQQRTGGSSTPTPPPTPPQNTQQSQSTQNTQSTTPQRSDPPKHPQNPYSSSAPQQAQTAQAQVDVVQYADYQDERTNLEKFNFSPKATAYLPQLLIGLGLVAVGVLGTFATWITTRIPSVSAFIALAFTLIAVGIYSQKGKMEHSSIASGIFLVLGWFIIGFAYYKNGEPIDYPVFLIFHLLYMIGGVMALYFITKVMEIQELNKRISVKLLKEARIFGEVASPNPHEAVILRNVSTTVAPITSVKDGSFLLHIDGLKIDEERYPSNMVVVRGHKAAFINCIIGQPGEYGLSPDGNIVRIIQGGITHIENNNPKAIEGVNTFKHKMKNVEAKTFVVVITPTPGPVKGFANEHSTIVSRQDVLKALVEYFEEPVDIVRRDVFDFLIPSLGRSK